MAHVAGEEALALHETAQGLLAAGDGPGQHAHLVIKGHLRQGRQAGIIPSGTGHGAAGHGTGQIGQLAREPPAEQHGQQGRHAQAQARAQAQDPGQLGLDGHQQARVPAQGVTHALVLLEEDEILHAVEKVQAGLQGMPFAGDLFAHPELQIHKVRQVGPIDQVVVPSPVLGTARAFLGLDEGIHDRTCVPVHQMGAQPVIGEQAHHAHGQAETGGQQHERDQQTPPDGGTAAHAPDSSSRPRR